MADTDSPNEPPVVPEPKLEEGLPLPEAKVSKGTDAGAPDVPPKEIKPDKKTPAPTVGLSRFERFKGWYASHKKISIPVSVLGGLVLLLIIPFTRYLFLSPFVSREIEISVVDSTTHTPVSGADVVTSGKAYRTDGNGKAKFKQPVGPDHLTIIKKYYKDQDLQITVPVIGSQTHYPSELQATGRQVKIIVNNTITKVALPDTDIKVLDITAKTDKDGAATIVLPAGTASQTAALTRNGYNDSQITIKVSDSQVEENHFSLTPAGKIYFLSKLSGKIDVVKSNLDGTKRETVLAGTGKEEEGNTVLLASRDWKYLALLSRRDSSLPKLYLIETASDKVTAIDEGNATFSLIGWSESNFLYQVNRQGYQPWQAKAQALKAYDAQAKKINLLDETSASGSDNFDYAYERYSSTYVAGQKLVFAKGWYANYYNPGALSDKQLTINSINPSGTGRQTHKSFGYAANQYTAESSYLYEPGEVYYQVVEKSADAKYYAYSNGSVVEKSDIKDDFEKYQNGGLINTYLASPSNNSTFWSEARDGKFTLFVGDQSGANGKQVATLSEYQTYGWYSDDYLLVQKKGSELYIFGKDGIKQDTDAVKISDYHKPAYNYYGYGGGYGGL